MKRVSLSPYASHMLFLSLVCAWAFFPEAAPGQKKTRTNGIEGIWTEVVSELEGGVIWSLPTATPTLGTGMVPSVPILWKFSKDKIETGPDTGLFPLTQGTYELNPGNKIGAIDVIGFDKQGKKDERDQWHAIYSLNDDWLIICGSKGMRPDTFTTGGKSDRGLIVLRRGKLK